MKDENYRATIEVARPPKKVFDAIKNVTKWWSTDFEGNSSKLNDEFIINHPGRHYSKQKLVELIPNKKLVWLVTESNLDWIPNDKEEWTNTKMIFEISTEGEKTLLHFTHEGLVPGKECYIMCEKGWNIVVKDWLLHLITTGEPSMEMARAAEIRNQHFDTKARKNDFHRTIAVNKKPHEAFEKIAMVGHWWAKNFRGSALNLGDTFKVEFGTTWVDFKIKEAIPGIKTTWLVTGSYLPWLKDKNEWTNTEVIFEISSQNDKSQIDFTHVGLVPGIECYENCEEGWTRFVTISLPRFINEGQGLPE